MHTPTPEFGYFLAHERWGEKILMDCYSLSRVPRDLKSMGLTQATLREVGAFLFLAMSGCIFHGTKPAI